MRKEPRLGKPKEFFLCCFEFWVEESLPILPHSSSSVDPVEVPQELAERFLSFSISEGRPGIAFLDFVCSAKVEFFVGIASLLLCELLEFCGKEGFFASFCEFESFLPC